MRVPNSLSLPRRKATIGFSEKVIHSPQLKEHFKHINILEIMPKDQSQQRRVQKRHWDYWSCPHSSGTSPFQNNAMCRICIQLLAKHQQEKKRTTKITNKAVTNQLVIESHFKQFLHCFCEQWSQQSD
jgi:hypothetical protein